MDELFCVKTFTKIMPAVRSVMSVRMSKYGFTQKDISKTLGITQPAVSQYISGSRAETADMMTKNKKMLGYIDRLSLDVINKKTDINTRICEICEFSRKSGVIKKEEMTPFLCILELDKGKNGKRA